MKQDIQDSYPLPKKSCSLKLGATRKNFKVIKNIVNLDACPDFLFFASADKNKNEKGFLRCKGKFTRFFLKSLHVSFTWYVSGVDLDVNAYH